MAWSTAEQHRIIEALAIACEVTGTSPSDPAKQFVLRELEAHPARMVLLALRRCTQTCKGRLALADVLGAMKDQDRKALSDGLARESAYLTTLRGCALVERIPWQQDNLPAVEAALTAKGYKCEKMPGYSSSKETRKILPHWTEPKEDEA